MWMNQYKGRMMPFQSSAFPGQFTIIEQFMHEKENDNRVFFSTDHCQRLISKSGTEIKTVGCTASYPTRAAARPTLPFGIIKTFDAYARVFLSDKEVIPNPNDEYRVANEDMVIERVKEIQEFVSKMDGIEKTLSARLSGMWKSISQHGRAWNPHKYGSQEWHDWERGYDTPDLIEAMRPFEAIWPEWQHEG